MNEKPSPWRDRKSAAAYLCCSPWTIDLYKRRGLITPKYLGRIPLYHVNELDRLPAQQPQPYEKVH